METRYCIEYVNPRHPLRDNGSINVRYDRVLTLEQAEHDLTLILSFGAKILNLYMGNAVDGKTGEWSPIPMIVDKDDWFTTDWLSSLNSSDIRGGGKELCTYMDESLAVNILWVLEKNGLPVEVFLSPQEAATYAASEIADVEKLTNEMLNNFDEDNDFDWSYGDYHCVKLKHS